MKKFDVTKLLEYINPITCTYEEWLQVGMALCHEGYPVEVWDSWSQQDLERYNDGECYAKWDSFRGNPTPITGATITQMAKERGWEPKEQAKEDKALAWDDVITDDVIVVDQHYIEDEYIKEPSAWNPIDEIIQYLEAVFDKSDIIGVSMQSMRRKDGKYSPSSAGVYTKTAGPPQEIPKNL